MRITWLTEGDWTGKIPRDHRNMRNDAAWMCVLDAEHQPLFGSWNDQQYDLAIITLPKKNFEHLVEKDVEIVDLVRQNLATKIAVIQEGPANFYQDYTLVNQIWYLNQLMSADFLLVHNMCDKLYYEGLFPDKHVHILLTLMLTDNIKTKNEKLGVIIGGNWTSWYSGQDSFFIAQEFDSTIYCPSMGRKISGEESIEGLKHLPYVDWTNWMYELSGFRYAVHLMRVIAAGTFFINTSYLSIPTIGYKQIDSARLLHPDTCVDLGDLSEARIIAKKLKEDQDFYDHCANNTKELFNKLYSESVFMESFNKIIKNEIL
ncbi:MAG: hypothetical protein H8E98_04570 [Bacteroidetes bacterium]|nr:hypothetical protein [Bacteroidota bacterium]